MTHDELRRRIIRRLDQADRGDRAWFLITRVHLSAPLLKNIATYLYDVGKGGKISLEHRHYDVLASLADVAGADPGVTLRRHHLLAMDTPLNLLTRTNGHKWNSVMLTSLGAELAKSSDSAGVLEQALSAIVFCRAPYYTAGRAREYGEFEVHPYRAALQVMRRLEGWIDRDEYDLFLSRVRRPGEVSWAIRGMQAFRAASPDQRTQLLDEVRQRIPGAKSYANWRDMGLHTFSLFSLGTSAIRTDQVLRLTGTLVEDRVAARQVVLPAGPAGPRQQTLLRLPDPPPNPELSVPPGRRELNAGDEGESIVAKLLKAAGWSVVFYTNRRGYGFDIWAQRGESVMVVEVKSSFEGLGPLILTRLEHEAAARYGRNFYVATVENIRQGNPIVRFVPNPIALRIRERNTREYAIDRAEWERAAEGLAGA